MLRYTRKNISLITPAAILIIGGIWYATFTTITEAGKIVTPTVTETIKQEFTVPYIVVRLDKNKLELHLNESDVKVFDLVSQGKPGSYYETIGGKYFSDYKEPLHFSSLGHVYMPFSIHLFGNYFIHGIPYSTDGTKLSSAYSGGCVRLNDTDAKIIYDFVASTTPIIITRYDENNFEPTKVSTTTISSMNMTRLMVATISLEFLNQDVEVLDYDNTSTTLRLNLIPKILSSNKINMTSLYENYVDEKRFVKEMNSKAKALGLSNTIFIDANTPVITTEEDYSRFMNHIITYKSYLKDVLDNDK